MVEFMVKKKMSGQKTYIFDPIGYISTQFSTRGEAPRQPGANRTTGTGIITLKPGCNFEQALEDLDGFERIWILYVFHNNENWKPKVLPPRSDNRKKGVFATRSPYRPNPIGISVCRLVSISGREVVIENPDMLDGTPVLDIKPYIPYADAFPDSATGWLRAHDEEFLLNYTVEVSSEARNQMDFINDYYGQDIFTRAIDTLGRDPMPHPYKRIKKHDGFCSISVKTWKLIFVTEGRHVSVVRVVSGYGSESIIAGISGGEGRYWDIAPHRKFAEKWPGSTIDNISRRK